MAQGVGPARVFATSTQGEHGRAGTRCREAVCSKRKSSVDDGALSKAFLRSKVAQPYLPMQRDITDADALQFADDGHVSVVGDVDLGAQVPRHGPSAWPPFTLEDEMEEDPFGHQLLGLDDYDRMVDNPEPAMSEGEKECELAPATSAPLGQPGAHNSHQLCHTAQVVWCRRRGHSAVSRLAVGVLRPCRGSADGAHPARIRRLREGRHPIIGAPLQ